jgi:magnesium-transporting ATPase (P-type)
VSRYCAHLQTTCAAVMLSPCCCALQLLWVNLIMDTMGALALATEDPNPDLLKDKVRRTFAD